MDNIHDNDDQSFNLTQRLSCLKEFEAINVNPSIVGLIIRSSCETLEDLVLMQLDDPKYPLLFDPQTCGGLLATVSSEQVDDVLKALHEAGYKEAAVIGRVTERVGEKRAIQLS